MGGKVKDAPTSLRQPVAGPASGVYINFRGLGTCPKCIRISFLVMVLSWMLVAIALSLHSNAAASVGIAVLASGFTILWLAHIATWAMRSHRLSHPADPSRRLAMGALGRAVLGAAIMSSTAIFPDKPKPIADVVVGPATVAASASATVSDRIPIVDQLAPAAAAVTTAAMRFADFVAAVSRGPGPCSFGPRPTAVALGGPPLVVARS